ncbi:recombinase family protein [Streptomyces sp. NPDC057494]|uniref:recombinase family protein n=1 Tax=Streptomyces sp. NPDC057494 TaxID=3346148 RepID=UPI0036D1B982
MDVTQAPDGRVVITSPQDDLCQKLVPQLRVRGRVTASSYEAVAGMDLAYARVSTTAQDLARQLDALRAAGVTEEQIYVDKRTGANMHRDGLTALLGFARPGDRINLLMDRLGRNMRETLNLVHHLTQRGIFLRTLGDKLAVDTTHPAPKWPSHCWRCSRRWNGSTSWSAPPAPARPRKPAACRRDGPRS